MEAGSLTQSAGRDRRFLRWAAPAVYIAVLSVVIYRDGVPVSRERLLIWILLGLLAFSLANVRGWARGVVLEWLPLALILWMYDLLRGTADGLLFDTNVTPQIDAEKLLFFGVVPSVWLQEKLWHGSFDLRWYDYAAWATYVSYFLAVYVLAAVLWFFARDRFRRYVACVSLLALMGFATYALFPAAPPWMASQLGEIGHVTRSIGLISGHIPIIDGRSIFDHGTRYANPVAAVPSLHAAYTLLISMFLWPFAPRWARPLLVVYPLAMAFALSYTAEHYLVDVLLGWIYAVFALWLVNRIADRRAAKVWRFAAE